jgi:metal-sulfur cluster biosynthetic enzyme
MRVDHGSVHVRLRLTSPVCLQAGNIITAVRERVLEVVGVSDVQCDIDHADEWSPEMMSAEARGERRRRRLATSSGPLPQRSASRTTAMP